MNYFKITAYATVILAIFACLNYFFPIQKTLIDKIEDIQIKEIIKKEKKNISLTLDKEIYKGERKWLLEAFNAATKIPYATTKAKNLHKVVEMSIEVKDFNMAVIAAKKIPYTTSQANCLMEIVNAAVKDINNLGYAVLAAEEIGFASKRSIALEIIVDSAVKFHSQDKQEKEKSNKSPTGTPEVEEKPVKPKKSPYNIGLDKDAQEKRKSVK